MTGSAAPSWAAARVEVQERRGDDADEPLDDLAAERTELARALLVARAKSMHPAGSGRR